MIRIEHSVVVQAPVEQVFSYAADYRRWPEWYQGLSDVTATTSVTLGNSARYAYTVRVLGVSATVETEIRDFVQNRGWAGISTKGIPHRTRWVFEPAGPATRFTHAVEGRLPVLLVGPLLDSLLLKPQWDRIVKNSLNNLRQRFERGADRPTGG